MREDLLAAERLRDPECRDSQTFQLAHVVARCGRAQALEVERPRADATETLCPLAGLVVVAHASRVVVTFGVRGITA